MSDRGRHPERKIDWADLRRRIDDAGRAIAGGAMVPPEQIAARLEERARALARPLVLGDANLAPTLISFTIAGEVYGVEPRWVLETSRLGHLSALPRAEPWIAGVAGWRGELVLAIDLRLLLGASPAPRAEHPVLVVLGGARPRLGVLADAPGELLTVSLQGLRPPPEGISGAQYLRGMTADAVSVLDMERVVEAVAPEPA